MNLRTRGIRAAAIALALGVLTSGALALTGATASAAPVARPNVCRSSCL